MSSPNNRGGQSPPSGSQHSGGASRGDNETAATPAELNFRRVTNKHTLKIYKQLLTKAYLPKKHLEYIEDFYGSEKMPMGIVSQQKYNQIFSARSFDKYGKMVSNKMSEKERMLANLQATFTAQAEAANDSTSAKSITKKQGKAVDELRTPTWKIGYKKAVYGPPGLAPPLPYILNSEGNERFYSYNGDWKQGDMEGGGMYKFADGLTYEGGFVRNRPNGIGKAIYSSGTTFEGEWLDGYPHGEGTMIYAVGSKYEGIWSKGRRHGIGKLTFPTGSYYEGDFLLGRFNGRGTYYSKDTGVTYVGSFENGYLAKSGTMFYPDGTRIVKVWPNGVENLSFNKAIDLINRERESEADAKRNSYLTLYATIREAELQSYVQDVRLDIKEDRKIAKQDAIAEKKRLQREAREKERERRLQSLLNADGEAIEGAEEEVKLLMLEKEEAAGRGGTPGGAAGQGL
ncbi:hypothetical protein TrRE_jg10296 [Triparma retinervis]|uniref:Uncharacterized protein n=1 Tax=Triparma retinervis TaxID=2557542 RepID=A0A9W7FBX2_9STRA|nr:hypothetical protein TrRE_jg10296 [Triparma retinervis]